MEKITLLDIVGAKAKKKISMVTAYDYPSAALVDKAGIDLILVGDSLAMVVLGYKDTLAVSMEEMLHHTRAVSRGVKRAFIIGDMPFLSYQTGVREAVFNAGRFLKEGGAQAVKLEGGMEILPQVKAIVEAGIPVQGHIGLTPQKYNLLGGFKVQGKTSEAAFKLLETALALEEAGCFSLVLEAIPEEVARMISEQVSIPTIGIGAGRYCDGQVLVFHDLLGLYSQFTPKFVKRYINLSESIEKALKNFKEEVEQGVFPAEEHVYHLEPEERAKLKIE
ncbi:MAG: 3-methyl-2-oxobutanoate hydroxymethyltransferase [Desulfonauticus sp. 38_4375]|jgi:3-methyl-2-oxobutanoate hydroxymethyltransferase|nr:MAG: 3-methyl-2-oxobutanoate hydroxymethyltransferase [Desulfonauticus sp. 38_4375]